MPDPWHLSSELDPTRVYPRGPRRHDDKSRIDPELRAAAGRIDDRLGRVIGAARIIAKRYQIPSLQARLDALDATLADLDKVKL